MKKEDKDSLRKKYEGEWLLFSDVNVDDALKGKKDDYGTDYSKIINPI